MTTVPKVSVAKILRRAKSLIRKGWTQGPFAVDKNGRVVDEESDAACKWCLAGAVNRAIIEETGGLDFDVKRDAKQLLQRFTRGQHYVTYNERRGRKKAQIVALLDRAIRAADKS